MYFLRLRHLPQVIVRYLPRYTKHRYQYHYTDQHGFIMHKDTICLTCLNTKYKSFSNIVDVFFFLTNFKTRMPKNLKDVFEISSDKKTWILVKRPLLHVSSTYLQTVHHVPEKTKKMYRFARRRRVPQNGTQTIHNKHTDRLRQRTLSATLSKKISNKKNQIDCNSYFVETL